MSTPAPGGGRLVGVWARPLDIDAGLAAAMLEDVVDLVAGMQQAAGAIVAEPGLLAAAQEVSWPGMPVVEVAAGSSAAAALEALGGLGAEQAALVCADVPDLPVLLLGKLFSALTSAEVAACPARDGGLAAAAARLPLPGWLAGAGWSMDDPDALSVLRQAAPPRALAVGPGWHRVRAAGDLDRLDPGLEGWDATRAHLATHRHPSRRP